MSKNLEELRLLVIEEHRVHLLVTAAVKKTFPVGTIIRFTKGRNKLEGTVTAQRFSGHELIATTKTGGKHTVHVGFYGFNNIEIVSTP